ncbi:hypothetical protein D3C73_963290 [compost metagenome]
MLNANRLFKFQPIIINTQLLFVNDEILFDYFILSSIISIISACDSTLLPIV